MLVSKGACWWCVVLVASLAIGPVACGGRNGTSPGDADAGLTSDAGVLGDANLTPDVFGGAPGTGSCLQLGASCHSGGDCCSNDCVNGFCNYPTCQSDNLPCTSSAQCCSQACAHGACAPLNTACSTIGNACSSNAACCSGLCSGGTCQASSFCVQPGDACATNGDCCTGSCTLASGHTIGTCAASAPSGPANCGVVDGQLCGGTGTNGTGTAFLDGGLPACGGPCCSRACAPWGPTGVLVCQPASGCKPVGDLCTTDSDCCGSSGLPGASNKPVTCDLSGGGPVGICRNPMGCKPNGDVCKLSTMSCNSSCDCCSGNCETQDTCKQDNVGVPRCTDAQCVGAGVACSSSADCCNGAPCVPSPGGTPPFVCAVTSCVPACGACSNNADCCPGTACELPAGSTQGTCGPCGSTGNGDGGTTAGDAGTPTGDGGSHGDAGCALYGQICTTSTDCCYGVSCTGGAARRPSSESPRSGLLARRCPTEVRAFTRVFVFLVVRAASA